MRRLTPVISAALLSTGAVLLASSCDGCFFTPPPAADPLPSWVMPKATFGSDDVWWFQRTVIDAPFDAPTYIGEGDLAETIRWKIEEKYLVAMRAAPLVVGVEGQDQYSELADAEAPLAVYPILWHFDVAEGQMVDIPKREWHQKAYIRVDWSTNLVAEWRFWPLLEVREPVAWFETKATSDDFPIWTADYLDFTTHAVLSATAALNPLSLQPVSCGGEFPEYVDCAPLDVTYRTSIRKRPADHQYEVFRTSDTDRPPFFSAGNLFASVTYEVDGTRGIIDSGRKQQLFRFNIWERSFDGDGAPLPYRERAVKPVAFHLDPKFPEELVDVVQAGVDVWDEPLREVVHELRAWECKDEGADLAACFDQTEKPERVLVLCANNPVKQGDHAACGPAGTLVRLGDMRFNSIQWVRNGTGLQPIAIAWWSPDVPTGEVVSTHVKFAAGSLDKTVQYLTDTILLAAGRSTVTSPFFGDPEGEMDLDAWRGLLTSQRQDLTTRAPNDQGAAARRDPLRVSEVSAPSLPTAPLVGTSLEAQLTSVEDLVAHGASLDADAMDYSPLRKPYLQAGSIARAREAALAQRAIDVSLPTDLDLAYYSVEWKDLGDEEIFDILRRELVRTTIAHELGHVLGIRHNFVGSVDALNFPREYWAARRTDCGARNTCPTPFTQAELDAHIHDYAYSSIMDYVPRLIATPVDLGPYDVAAIKALYGKMSQVFEDTTLSESEDAVRTVVGLSDTTIVHFPLTFVADAAAPGGRRPTSKHYSKYPQIFGDLSRRMSVPGRHMDVEQNRLVSTMGHLVVPFMTCDDRNLGLFAHCQQFDHGADPYEIVKHAEAWWDAYYPVNNFRRGRQDWKTDEVVGQIASRVHAPLSMWNNQYGQYRIDFAPYPEVFDDPDILGPTTAAVRDSFRFFARLLATPEAGAHVVSNLHDGVDALVPARQTNMFFTPPPAGAIDIPVPFGRLMRSGMVPDGGGFRISNIGNFVEKGTALEALLSAGSWYFPGRESWESIEMWTVNYYTTFPDATLDLLGSVIADDWNRLAPRLDGDTFRYRDFLDPASTVPGMVVSPGSGINQRMRVAAMAAAWIGNTYGDRTILDYMRIQRVGADEAVPAEGTAVELLDPDTGVRSRAFSYVKDGLELGIGARVLTRASDIAARLSVAVPGSPEAIELQLMLDRQRMVIDVLRGVVAKYDEEWFEADNGEEEE